MQRSSNSMLTVLASISDAPATCILDFWSHCSRCRCVPVGACSKRVPCLCGRGHFIDGVSSVGGVNGARRHCAVVCQVIRHHHPLLPHQHVHYRRSYPALVEPCTAIHSMSWAFCDAFRTRAGWALHSDDSCMWRVFSTQVSQKQPEKRLAFSVLPLLGSLQKHDIRPGHPVTHGIFIQAISLWRAHLPGRRA